MKCYACNCTLRGNARSHAIYCSDGCRARAFRQRRREAAKVLNLATAALEEGRTRDWQMLNRVGMGIMRSTPGGPDVDKALDAIGFTGPRGPFA